MTEEVIENVDSTNDEVLILEEPAPAEAPAEDAEALKKRLAEVEATNKRLYARLKKEEVKKEPVKQPEETGDAGTRLARLEKAEEKRQFGYQFGLSPEETDKVYSVTPNPTKETLEDPFIKAGLEAIRRAKRVAGATPSPSSKTPKIGGKSWSEMSKEERAKNYGLAFKKATGRE